MNKSQMTLGPFETKPHDDDMTLCEIGAWATDGTTEKYFGVVVERGEHAIQVGHAYLTAMFEEFRDHRTMIERCQCGMTRERAFGADEQWAKIPCVRCKSLAISFDPRVKPANGRTLHWNDGAAASRN